MTDRTTSGARCSFCGKGMREVRSLVAGPYACICEDCVRNAVEIIGAEHQDWLADLIATMTRGP